MCIFYAIHCIQSSGTCVLPIQVARIWSVQHTECVKRNKFFLDFVFRPCLINGNRSMNFMMWRLDTISERERESFLLLNLVLLKKKISMCFHQIIRWIFFYLFFSTLYQFQSRILRIRAENRKSLKVNSGLILFI